MENNNLSVTRFSLRDGEDGVKLRPNRPLILISSTSWTQDEDFSILLDALVKFDRVAQVTHTQYVHITLT